MKLVSDIRELQRYLGALSSHGTVGFVPTMGALHKGHLSLVEKAMTENDLVVVSIFVNPTQFNDSSDLERYPRNLDADLTLLEPLGCHFVFQPSVEAIYPEPDNRIFDLGGLDKVMEGKFRPGHFNGVAQVVSRLFEFVKPDNAYFGLKDFQQLAIIRYLTAQMKFPVNIIACPIIREANGLAMSSRNELLSEEERRNAAVIYQTLNKSHALKESYSVSGLEKWIQSEINKNAFMDVEYAEIVDTDTLQPVESWSNPGTKIVCVAVWCGKVRLIDNMVFN
jgi:pantoate--beta-alanine ligase